MKARTGILCVDDEKIVLNSLVIQLKSMLVPGHDILRATSGEEALSVIEQYRAEGGTILLVISDYIMPGMRGDELLIKIKAVDARIRKIMLTGYSSVDGIKNAINGASLYRFISKPWDEKDLLLTVMEAIKSFEQELKVQKLSETFKQLYVNYENNYREQRTRSLEFSRVSAQMIDLTTGQKPGHSECVAAGAVALGKAAGLSDESLWWLEQAALLHGIGLVGAEPNQNMMRTVIRIKEMLHPLSDSEKLLRGVFFQYECYDGTGMQSLAADKIPLEGRILAVVRQAVQCYESGGGRECTALVNAADSKLDPALVKLWCALPQIPFEK